MTNKDEVRQVLKMVSEGKITVDEADQLIAAIQESYEEESSEGSSNDILSFDNSNITSGIKKSGEAKWFRVKISELDTGKVTTNMLLPVGFTNLGLHKFLKSRDFGIKSSEFYKLATMDSFGQPTMIIDVEDSDANERVQIFIE